jgi:hypothetical protein
VLLTAVWWLMPVANPLALPGAEWFYFAHPSEHQLGPVTGAA